MIHSVGTLLKGPRRPQIVCRWAPLDNPKGARGWPEATQGVEMIPEKTVGRLSLYRRIGGLEFDPAAKPSRR